MVGGWLQPGTQEGVPIHPVAIVTNLDDGILRILGTPEDELHRGGVSVIAVPYQLDHRYDFAADQLRTDRSKKAGAGPDAPITLGDGL